MSGYDVLQSYTTHALPGYYLDGWPSVGG